MLVLIRVGAEVTRLRLTTESPVRNGEWKLETPHVVSCRQVDNDGVSGGCICKVSLRILGERPVTPSSVWCRAPDKIPPVSFAIACGWSPAGLRGATSSYMQTKVEREAGSVKRRLC